MKVIINILRFLIYIPLSLVVLWVMYYLIELMMVRVVGLSLGWLIVWVVLFGATVSKIIPFVFSYIIPFISRINPYKTAGKIILIPCSILYLIIEITVVWKSTDYSYTRDFIMALICSISVIYSTMVFCAFISSKSGEKMIIDDDVD